MYNQGTVYISKKTNVYDLLANDDLETLEQLVEDEKAQKYISDNFGSFNGSRFIDDLKYDLALLKKVDILWEPIHEDPKITREMIKDNFDPNSIDHQDDIKYLITTDILAEGINLHRSNVLINYDLPWNPTRVLQRVGHVNRLGSKYKNIFIFNFFPTSHSDRHLGLENNITNKLQMFHYIMGEDAKYLTEGEEIGSQELFNTLNSKKAYSGEEEETSELKYLEMMRELRDGNPDLFEKIKRLPKKTRSGMKKPELEKNELITFFRPGKLKKFYLNTTGKSQEINFFDAVEKLECPPTAKRFTLFIKNLLNDIDTTRYNEYRGNLIKDAYKNHIRQYKRIGKFRVGQVSQVIFVGDRGMKIRYNLEGQKFTAC